MREAQFYKKLDNQTVACELCCHFCNIKNQAVGICGVRKNINGILYSLVYGQPAAMNIDPVEKKPLFHFQPGSKTFSLGTLGCNFKCANCQNWEISQATPPDDSPRIVIPTAREESLDRGNNKYKGFLTPLRSARNDKKEIIEPKKIVEQALESGCQSIAYTYNEPTVFAEYALDIMKLAKQKKIKNIWVSNGYMSPVCLEALVPYLDAANIDLKSMAEEFYQKICRAKLKPVLDNLINLKKAKVHLEITTLVIPGLSAGQLMLKQLAEFIVHDLGADTPWHVSKFSPEISWKLKTTPATTEKTILKAWETGKKAGLKYVYIGNIYNTDKENTYCPKCGELAIKRLGYNIARYDKNGYCAKCKTNLIIID